MCTAAKSLQSCPTLCDPIDGSQPTRLPRPWDSPGKNTGVGCHVLLQCMKVKSESEVAQSCATTLRDPMDCSLPGSSIHGIFQARVLEWGAITFSDKCAQGTLKWILSAVSFLVLYVARSTSVFGICINIFIEALLIIGKNLESLDSAFSSNHQYFAKSWL